MDILAGKLGSMVFGLFESIGGSFPASTWYGTFLDCYCHDTTLLGYLAMAGSCFIVASCARVVHKPRACIFFEVFPRSCGDVGRARELLRVPVLHDKTGKRN